MSNRRNRPIMCDEYVFFFGRFRRVSYVVGALRGLLTGDLPISCWSCIILPDSTHAGLQVSIRTTTASSGRRSGLPRNTVWNFCTGTSAPISVRATAKPGSLASICKNTAAASFPSRTATRKRSTGTGKSLPNKSKGITRRKQRVIPFVKMSIANDGDWWFLADLTLAISP